MPGCCWPYDATAGGQAFSGGDSGGCARDTGSMSASEWTDADHVERYLSRLGEGPGSEGDVLLLELVPQAAGRVLDLGTGHGRLLDLLQRDRPGMNAVGIDFSPLMLEKARTRFAEDPQVEILEHDLADRLPGMGGFDAVFPR